MASVLDRARWHAHSVNMFGVLQSLVTVRDMNPAPRCRFGGTQQRWIRDFSEADLSVHTIGICPGVNMPCASGLPEACHLSRRVRSD
jgi:hypothetical protein